MFAFVLFHLVFLYQVKKLAGKNISEMTYVVSGGMQNLNQSINPGYITLQLFKVA